MHRLLIRLIAFCAFAPALACADEAIDFQRDIRPILSDKCFFCHGPDEDHREADLRLDVPASALEYAIVPGKSDESELIARIDSDDPDLLMPPADSGKKLTGQEFEMLRRWIDQGAEFQTHWAFVPPTRPEVPKLSEDANWSRNPIDAFVFNRLKREQLGPAPEADRSTWLRRVTLDLIGLLPTIEELDAFLADQSHDAFEKQIERLLESDHFGERWGRIWLDAARYADSNGYEKDAPREMWFYRDWVIKAFNEDKPFDQFIIEQIAGDLLAKGRQEDNGRGVARAHQELLARQDLLVATGFLRNSMINEEGGADPEQFRMEAMFDRMDAIGKSVLGLTIQCAQCHSHKYDPLTQEEYYGMFAFLNSTHDSIIPVYTPLEQERRTSILSEIESIERELQQSMPDWQDRMSAWEDSARSSQLKWEILEPVEKPFEGQKFRTLDDWSILSESYAPKASTPKFVMHTKAEQITGFRLELLTHPKLPRGGPGRSARGTAALSEMKIEIAPLTDPGKRTTVKLVSVSADVNPSESPQPDYLKDVKAKDGDKRVTGPAEFAIDGDPKTAWTTDIDPGRRNQSRKIVFVPESPIEGFDGGTAVTFSPSMNHGGWNNNDNHNCLMGRYRFSLTTDEAPAADPLPKRVRELLDVAPEKRTDQQRAAVFRHWRTTVDAWRDQNERIESLWQQYPEGTTQLVLREREKARPTHLLNRGDFLSAEYEVNADVPSFLHPLPAGAERSRLTFARWLVDDRSPTTARSIVNRIWQAYFGIGLVETSDELGSQSTPPSHPELLDWLAVELVDNDWSLKHLHRLITSSATYRQSSNVRGDMHQRDPYNRLLARGPRFRVDAEIVRDIALQASGLLSRQVGGPSVYPPAPRFLFEPPASYGPKTWNDENGENRYRRGLYTFRFRSVPYPMMETFDAVPGTVSCVRRARSNTPLQALTLLNEPLFMECARALGEQTLANGGDSDQSRIRYAMRRCLARAPEGDEMRTLLALLQKQRARLSSNEIDAHLIVTARQKDPAANSQEKGQKNDPQAAERAAWTLLSRVLLNLDETITKE